jgi:hypothetical protein
MTEGLERRFDFVTFFVALTLVVAGIVSIYSATYDAGFSEIASRQLLWAAVGMAVLCAALLVPSRFLQRVSFPLYFASLILLFLVLLLGKTVSGSTSWFSIGTLRFQPSEFAKVTTALAISAYLSRTEVNLTEFRHLMVAGAIILLPVALIMMQPDFGTAVIYLGMFLPVMYWGGASKFALIAVLAPGLSALAALLGTTPFLIAITVIGILLYLTKKNRIAAAAMFSLVVLVGVSAQFIYSGLKPYQQKNTAQVYSGTMDGLHLLRAGRGVRLHRRYHRSAVVPDPSAEGNETRGPCQEPLLQHPRDQHYRAVLGSYVYQYRDGPRTPPRHRGSAAVPELRRIGPAHEPGDGRTPHERLCPSEGVLTALKVASQCFNMYSNKPFSQFLN